MVLLHTEGEITEALETEWYSFHETLLVLHSVLYHYIYII